MTGLKNLVRFATILGIAMVSSSTVHGDISIPMPPDGYNPPSIPPMTVSNGSSKNTYPISTLCGKAIVNPQFYEVIAPANGTYEFNTEGSTFHTMLGIFTGTLIPSALVPAGCGIYSTTQFPDTDGQPVVTLNLEAGYRYWVVVDNADKTKGTANFNWISELPSTFFTKVAVAPTKVASEMAVTVGIETAGGYLSLFVDSDTTPILNVNGPAALKTYTWTNTTVTPGAHTLHAVWYDGKGSQVTATSASVPFTISAKAK